MGTIVAMMNLVMTAAAGTVPKIRRIWTRYPNLECGLFAALLEIDRVRVRLGITSGEINWRFISTAQLDDPEREVPDENWEKTLERKGIVYFNAGRNPKRGWDQHGRPENRSLCEICSLDLVRGTYDFLAQRPWLREIYSRVRQNDIDATAVSTAPNNLRQLMSPLTGRYLQKPELMLEFLKIGFLAIFNRCQAGVSANDAFGLEEMLKGVAETAPDKLEWFQNLASEAIQANAEDEAEARTAVDKAERLKKTASVRHEQLPRPLRVIELRTDSSRADKVARRKRYDVIIVWRSDGHVQIFTGTPYEYGEEKDENGKPKVIAEYRVDLGEVAKRLRIMEANFADPHQRLAKADWTGSGFVYYENGTGCPWYLAEFRTLLANGTQSSRDVPVTRIRHDKLFDELVATLPDCRLIRRTVSPDGAKGEWGHMEPLKPAPRRPDSYGGYRPAGNRRGKTCTIRIVG